MTRTATCERDSRRFRDEGHRSAGARVRLEHEHLAVLHGVLHVDETHDLQGVRDLPRTLAQCGEDVVIQRLGG